jgi:hypothetical protein
MGTYLRTSKYARARNATGKESATLLSKMRAPGGPEEFIPGDRQLSGKLLITSIIFQEVRETLSFPELGDFHVFAAFDGEVGLTGRGSAMPAEIAVQAVFRVVDAVGHSVDRVLIIAGFKIDSLDRQVDGTLFGAEQFVAGGGEDLPIVLGDDVLDVAEVGAVVEDDPLLAVVDIEAFRDHVLPEDEAIAEPLHGHIAEDLVVILVAGGEEADGMAGIGDKLLLELVVADALIDDELGVLNVDIMGVLQVHGAPGRVHLIGVHEGAEFEVLDRYLNDTELTGELLAFHRGQDAPGASLRVMFLRCFPGREKDGIRFSHGIKGGPWPDDVIVEHGAGVLALELDIRAAVTGIDRFDVELGPAGLTVDFLDGWFGNPVAGRRVGKIDRSAAAPADQVNGPLDGLGIVSDTITPGADIHDIEPAPQKRLFKVRISMLMCPNEEQADHKGGNEKDRE